MRKHTQHYVILCLALCATLGSGPSAGDMLASLYADLLPDMGTETQVQRLQEITAEMEAAAQQANRNLGSAPDAQIKRQQGLNQLELADKTIGQMMRDKRRVRLEWARQRNLVDIMKNQYNIDAADEQSLEDAKVAHRDAFVKVLRGLQRESTQRTEQPLLFQLLVSQFGQNLQRQLAYQALARSHVTVLNDIYSSRDLPASIAALRSQHLLLQESYHAAQADYDAANHQIALSDARLQEIKRIQAAVDAKIRQMQIKMKEYDEQIRLRIEKELVSKGLMAPREGGYKPPTFIWPVSGEITAGFYESSYQRYFGVPHKAIDIRQPQGSAVRASARGIVYHVQYGGAYGYSYVLIGHQGGYATLYGHLFDIYVVPGEEIGQGEILGLSGGKPGTRGAGPMTTGSHLHFEVIKDGAHVNPTTVLP